MPVVKNLKLKSIAGSKLKRICDIFTLNVLYSGIFVIYFVELYLHYPKSFQQN